MPNPCYVFDGRESQNIAEIGVGVVATNVRFVLDQTLTLKSGQWLELDNGQWFLVEVISGEVKRSLLPGKWDR